MHPSRSKTKKPPIKKRPLRGGGRKERAPKKKNAAAARRTNRSAILRALRAAAARAGARRPHQLERHEGNPIVEPREDRFWEMKATFNPGAVYADKRVHLLYRAIGGDDVSVLGYASSNDGVTVIERLDEPAYIPKHTKKTVSEKDRMPAPAYLSGGGWNGGCEDPRLTLLEGRVYLTYTAFDGWGSVRIALSSIGLNDFLNKRWRWKEPTLISPPGEIHKNWMLFPEKIKGKFALLHSISPSVLVDYFDTIEELESGKRIIQSHRSMNLRRGVWDSWVRSAGPPPIKTRLGWLVFYHAHDVREPDRYKLGAMILGADDPTNVLYRSKSPVLEPDFSYENDGLKSGIVYSCGAVVKDGELYVYYGGSDTVVCVAMAHLDTFLDELQRHGRPRLEPEKRTARNASR